MENEAVWVVSDLLDQADLLGGVCSEEGDWNMMDPGVTSRLMKCSCCFVETLLPADLA